MMMVLVLVVVDIVSFGFSLTGTEWPRNVRWY